MTESPDTLIALAGVAMVQLTLLAIAVINTRQNRGTNAQLRNTNDQLQNGSTGKFRDAFDAFVIEVRGRFDAQDQIIRQEQKVRARADAAVGKSVARLREQLDKPQRGKRG